MVKTELEAELHKSRAEEAALKDALLKMQSLNEGLGQDKVELNKIIMAMEAEKSALYNAKKNLEQDKTTLRDELIRVGALMFG